MNATEKLVKLMSEQTDFNFTPGSEFAYTNINYILLGEIVKKVSGLSLREFAHQNIFGPLQMNQTYFHDGADRGNTPVAIAYKPKNKNPQKFSKRKMRSDGIVGDHNLITSLDDLIKWDQNFYHNQLGTETPCYWKKCKPVLC